MTETIHTIPTQRATPEVSFTFTPTAGPFSYSVGAEVYTPTDAYWVCADTVITFTASATFVDEDENAVAYEWDFGDGTKGYGLTVTHQFAANNPHNQVVLTVVDNLGRRWRARRQLYLKSYADIVAATAPDEYWPLIERRGTTAENTASLSGDGTYTGSFTLGQAGPLSGADLAVDLTGGYILTTAAPFVAAGSITVAGWANRDTSAGRDTLFGSTNVRLSLEAGSTDVKFWTNTAGAAATWTAAWPGDDEWVHWALRFNDTTNDADLYVNGDAVSTQTQAVAYSSPGNMQIGSSNASDPFDGKMAHVAVWDRILSGADILNLYNAVA